MVEYIIRRAIIWAITIAVVAGVSAAVANATRNAMSKSLEEKLTQLGIDKNNPDPELMGELIDVEVVRRGTYVVSVSENVFGKFSTTYTARSKKDAIKKLGKKVFGFVNVFKNDLSDEEKKFYLNIWHETFLKEKMQLEVDSYISKRYSINIEISEIKEKVIFSKKRIEDFNKKEKKLSLKQKNKPDSNRIKKKMQFVKEDRRILNKDIEKLVLNLNQANLELDKINELINIKNDQISNPQFDISKNKIGIKGYEIKMS